MAAVHGTWRGRRGAQGITLVELLVALFVFAIVAALASSGIVQSLRVQSVNEANTSLQGKLRRITEVISQDLRSTVLGAVVDTPFASASDQVSFTLAVGGQGFEARRIATDNVWPGASSLRVFADAQPVATGDRILIVNGSGLGTTVPVGSVQTLSNNRYDVSVGAACTIGISFVHPVRMFVVDAVGYRLLANGDLVRQAAGADPEALAFDLSGFEVQYGYREQGGGLTMLPAPRSDGGPPLRVDGDELLESLRVRVSAEQTIFGNRTVERSYVTQIALPPPGSVNLRSVVSCP